MSLSQGREAEAGWVTCSTHNLEAWVTSRNLGLCSPCFPGTFYNTHGKLPTTLLKNSRCPSRGGTGRPRGKAGQARWCFHESCLARGGAGHGRPAGTHSSFSSPGHGPCCRRATAMPRAAPPDTCGRVNKQTGQHRAALMRSSV